MVQVPQLQIWDVGAHVNKTGVVVVIGVVIGVVVLFFQSKGSKAGKYRGQE